MARNAVWCAVFSSIRNRVVCPRTRSANSPPPGITSSRRRCARRELRRRSGRKASLRPRLPPTVGSRSRRNAEMLRRRRPSPSNPIGEAWMICPPYYAARSLLSSYKGGRSVVGASVDETTRLFFFRQQDGDRRRGGGLRPGRSGEARRQRRERGRFETGAARRRLCEERARAGRDGGGPHRPRLP